MATSHSSTTGSTKKRQSTLQTSSSTNSAVLRESLADTSTEGSSRNTNSGTSRTSGSSSRTSVSVGDSLRRKVLTTQTGTGTIGGTETGTRHSESDTLKRSTKARKGTETEAGTDTVGGSHRRTGSSRETEAGTFGSGSELQTGSSTSSRKATKTESRSQVRGSGTEVGTGFNSGSEFQPGSSRKATERGGGTEVGTGFNSGSEFQPGSSRKATKTESRSQVLRTESSGNGKGTGSLKSEALIDPGSIRNRARATGRTDSATGSFTEGKVRRSTSEWEKSTVSGDNHRHQPSGLRQAEKAYPESDSDQESEKIAYSFEISPDNLFDDKAQDEAVILKLCTEAKLVYNPRTKAQGFETLGRYLARCFNTTGVADGQSIAYKHALNIWQKTKSAQTTGNIIAYEKAVRANVEGKQMDCLLFDIPEGGSVLNYLQEMQDDPNKKVSRSHIKQIIKSVLQAVQKLHLIYGCEIRTTDLMYRDKKHENIVIGNLSSAYSRAEMMKSGVDPRPIDMLYQEQKFIWLIR